MQKHGIGDCNEKIHDLNFFHDTTNTTDSSAQPLRAFNARLICHWLKSNYSASFLSFLKISLAFWTAKDRQPVCWKLVKPSQTFLCFHIFAAICCLNVLIVSWHSKWCLAAPLISQFQFFLCCWVGMQVHRSRFSICIVLMSWYWVELYNLSCNSSCYRVCKWELLEN